MDSYWIKNFQCSTFSFKLGQYQLPPTSTEGINSEQSFKLKVKCPTTDSILIRFSLSTLSSNRATNLVVKDNRKRDFIHRPILAHRKDFNAPKAATQMYWAISMSPRFYRIQFLSVQARDRLELQLCTTGQQKSFKKPTARASQRLLIRISRYTSKRSPCTQVWPDASFKSKSNYSSRKTRASTATWRITSWSIVAKSWRNRPFRMRTFLILSGRLMTTFAKRILQNSRMQQTKSLLHRLLA